MFVDCLDIYAQAAFATIRNPNLYMTLLRRFLSMALAASLITMAGAQEAKIKIATVDMQELFKQYYRTNEAQKQINLERARIQKDNNERLGRIRELETNLGNLKKQIEDPSINDSKKQTLFKDWQMQQQEGIALDRERREFLQRRNQALNEKMVQRMKGILEEIRKLVEEQAKTDNYDYVFDKSGLSTSQVPFLLYTKDATDITAGLLKDLNKDAPAESAPAEEEAQAPEAGE
ncbi:OmpH family outer membrane protein [Luteolibacter algae]|uniref:OmpH family outer membrane protein n=1 Tax=Luteolibacter algae TaxID=454151 RepID=A0ABW5DBU7_9BACT